MISGKLKSSVCLLDYAPQILDILKSPYPFVIIVILCFSVRSEQFDLTDISLTFQLLFVNMVGPHLFVLNVFIKKQEKGIFAIKEDKEDLTKIKE